MRFGKKRSKTMAEYQEDYKRCRICRHGGTLSGCATYMLVPCMYIVNTGKPRPCQPGKKCTVYDPLKEVEDEQ